MDIQEKQAKWKQERPLFEAEFIHSHLLPFFNFNEHTGDYEIKCEFAEDEDRKLAYEILNTGWAMWLRAKRDAKAQAVPEGFVVVPKEPTKEMIHIGESTHYGYDNIDSKHCYIAMIEAAQEPAND
ncbi:hypothetical protein [Acinetobacter sp. YH12029]|uniref:hypothetical protein n=1 Tax=Acinetobacter sp. YH12029 TaxID=2601044 RepID=UPI0015D2753A|nr:hypothetical protein [Acinetobacter sp. YH12029]